MLDPSIEAIAVIAPDCVRANDHLSRAFEQRGKCFGADMPACFGERLRRNRTVNFQLVFKERVRLASQGGYHAHEDHADAEGKRENPVREEPLGIGAT